MILFDLNKAHRLVWILLPTLMLLGPLASSAQNITSTKRLQQASSYLYSDLVEPSGSTLRKVTYNYDTTNPFQINSYLDYVGITSETGQFMYMEDTYNFTGVTNYYADSFTYTSPTLCPGYTRTCKLDYDGYMLEDNYSFSTSPQTYQIANKYTYNASMKLICKIRSDYYRQKHWKTECLLDSLGRRVEEINYASLDSLDWTPTRKLEYTYSEEQITYPYQFEKYNLYAPDFSFYRNMHEWDWYNPNDVQTLPFYLCDNWLIGSYTSHFFQNGAWVLGGTYEVTVNHVGLSWYLYTNDGFANRCQWDNFGMPVIMSGGGVDAYEYNLSFSSPSALEDSNEGVPAAFSVSAYPNPNQGHTQLIVKTEKQEPVTVCTYNIRGQKLKEELVHANPSGATSLSWQATDNTGKPLPNGIYVLKLIGSTHKQVKRITVAR